MGRAMAVKTTDVKKTDADPQTANAAPNPAEPIEAPKGGCVVDDGTPHMSGGLIGKVCSAHQMHYDANGNRRK